MTAKEYLEQSRLIRQEIVWINRQIEEIETSLGYHPLQLDDSGASKASVTDKVGDKLAKVADLYTDLTQKKGELILKDEEIHQAINLLEDPQERMVLWYRYLERHPHKVTAPLGWRTIGFRMGYTAEGARHIHTRALKNFANCIKKTES